MKRFALRPTLFVPMTGTAEDNRKILPDPAKPQLINSGFEQGLDEKGFAEGWYYQRQLTLETGSAEDGANNFVQFKNNIPGQLAQVMQAFACDGRKVPLIKFSASFSCENVVVGPRQNDLPTAVISFYDEDRQELGMFSLGAHKGTKDWFTQSRVIRIPRSASREGLCESASGAQPAPPDLTTSRLKRSKNNRGDFSSLGLDYPLSPTKVPAHIAPRRRTNDRSARGTESGIGAGIPANSTSKSRISRNKLYPSRLKHPNRLELPSSPVILTNAGIFEFLSPSPQ